MTGREDILKILKAYKKNRYFEKGDIDLFDLLEKFPVTKKRLAKTGEIVSSCKENITPSNSVTPVGLGLFLSYAKTAAPVFGMVGSVLEFMDDMARNKTLDEMKNTLGEVEVNTKKIMKQNKEVLSKLDRLPSIIKDIANESNLKVQYNKLENAFDRFDISGRACISRDIGNDLFEAYRYIAKHEDRTKEVVNLLVKSEKLIIAGGSYGKKIVQRYLPLKIEHLRKKVEVDKKRMLSITKSISQNFKENEDIMENNDFDFENYKNYNSFSVKLKPYRTGYSNCRDTRSSTSDGGVGLCGKLFDARAENDWNLRIEHFKSNLNKVKDSLLDAGDELLNTEGLKLQTEEYKNRLMLKTSGPAVKSCPDLEHNFRFDIDEL